ncbi:hypothetical protein BDW68DRAFT_183010 [Aspergillus falconensis]
MDQILRLQHEISQINVVVANARICNHYGPLVDMTDCDLWVHLEVNTFRLLRLFRALLPFLRASQHQLKSVYMPTELASLSRLEQNNASLTNAYGMSKAAGNCMSRRLYFEHEELTMFAVDPSFVQTDMRNRGACVKGLEMATLTVDESVNGITRQIVQATKASTSGQLLHYRANICRGKSYALVVHLMQN